MKNYLMIGLLFIVTACGASQNEDGAITSCATDLLPTTGSQIWECKQYVDTDVFSQASTMFSFNADGTSCIYDYDENGNLVNAGTCTHTWKKASCGAVDISADDSSNIHMGTIQALAKDEISAVFQVSGSEFYAKCFLME